MKILSNVTVDGKATIVKIEDIAGQDLLGAENMDRLIEGRTNFYKYIEDFEDQQAREFGLRDTLSYVHMAFRVMRERETMLPAGICAPERNLWDAAIEAIKDRAKELRAEGTEGDHAWDESLSEASKAKSLSAWLEARRVYDAL